MADRKFHLVGATHGTDKESIPADEQVRQLGKMLSDFSASLRHTALMSEQPPTPDLDPKLQAIEARMDERLARMEREGERRREQMEREMQLRQQLVDQQVSAMSQHLSASSDRMDERMNGFLAAQVERDKRVDAELARAHENTERIITSISSMKTTVIVTALSAVIAIVGGVAAFNATLTSNMLSAYQTGKGDRPAAEAPATPQTPPAPARQQ